MGSVSDTLLTSLLTSPRHNVPFSDIGKTLANIGAFELPVMRATSLIAGLLFDRFGRKPLILTGTTIIGLLCLVMPYLPNIYPDLAIARSALAFFTGFASQAPLTADYFHPKSRGLASGIIYITAVFGDFCGYTALSFLIKDNSIEFVYTVFASFMFVITGMVVLTIRGGRYHLSQMELEEETSKKEEEQERGPLGIFQDFIAGFREGRNPWIFIAFYSIFLVGIQGPMSSKIFVLWIQSFYDNTEEGKAAGYAKLASINAFGQLATLLVAIFGSVLLDRVSKFAFLLPGAFLQSLGVVLQLLFQDPNSWIIVVSQAIQNSGSNMLSLVQTLIISLHAPAEHRGKVFGAQNSVWAIGGMVSGIAVSYTHLTLPTIYSV
eukprot:TRINITY_DN23035_c0_g1_i1.p1 TRINITY_DN23035_c0_g1~~TRINITY_DN23035_c0_g1_i1.p1  ORF type:complete len:378 (-),score=72.26 TRINITY_DN23035_c0_g1_i1:35-1168(-)